eukprot:gene10611-biopygen15352
MQEDAATGKLKDAATGKLKDAARCSNWPRAVRGLPTDAPKAPAPSHPNSRPRHRNLRPRNRLRSAEPAKKLQNPLKNGL